MFIAAMEMTVVSTAMPTVVAELGGALHYSWVFSAYMLATTVTVPIYGKLADLYGRKPVMLVAMVIFLVASVACGQARTMTMLIAFRALQGIGAGGLQPIAITVVGDIFSVEERARMQGIFGAVWGVAGLVGPLVGGLIVSTLSWRWVFYINVPFGIVAGVILAFALVEDIEKKDHELDFLGAGVLSVGVIALLVGVEGYASWLLLPLSAIAFVGFVVVELRAAEPLLPPRLFRRRIFAVASTIATIAGAAMIGLLTFLPLYAQGVLGVSPTAAGAAIAPMAIAWPAASALSGRLLGRFGFRPLVRTGMAILFVATLYLVWILGHDPSTTTLKIAAAAFGAGMGLANTAIVISVQTSVSFSERGVATSSTMFFRSIGGTVGVGIMGAVLAHSLMRNPLMHGSEGSALIARILGPERKQVPPALLAAVAGDLEHGILLVAWLIVGLGVLALVAASFFPVVERKT